MTFDYTKYSTLSQFLVPSTKADGDQKPQQVNKNVTRLKLVKFQLFYKTYRHKQLYFPSNRRACWLAPFTRKFNSSTSSFIGFRSLLCLKDYTSYLVINSKKEKSYVLKSHFS